MDAYIKKTGVDKNSVRFMFDGQRLRGEQTADQVEFTLSSLLRGSLDCSTSTYLISRILLLF